VSARSWGAATCIRGFPGRRPPRRGRRPCDRIGACDRGHAARFRPGPWTVQPAEPPAVDPGELYGVVPTDVRSSYDAREVIARIVDGSRFHEFKERYGATLVCGFAHIHGTRWGSSRTTACCSRRAPEGRTLHRAVRSPSGAARVPAEHQRLHGGPRLRTRRHREGRREACDGGQLRSRAEADGDRRRLVRRRQLRHVRSAFDPRFLWMWPTRESA